MQNYYNIGNKNITVDKDLVEKYEKTTGGRICPEVIEDYLDGSIGLVLDTNTPGLPLNEVLARYSEKELSEIFSGMLRNELAVMYGI